MSGLKTLKNMCATGPRSACHVDGEGGAKCGERGDLPWGRPLYRGTILAEAVQRKIKALVRRSWAQV
mgnify:CR=1 FL=1